MSEDRRSILEMLAQGKINTDEAERLLAALDKSMSAESGAETRTKPKAKYLRVLVEDVKDKHGVPTKVNVRVPMQLLRAGVKLASLIPDQAHAGVNTALHEQGVKIDLSQIKPENLEEIVDTLEDLTVDVDQGSGHGTVRIFAE